MLSGLEGKEGRSLGGARSLFNQKPTPDDIGSQNGKSTHCFLLTWAFHRARLWGRHCLTASWCYQWHTRCLFSSRGRTNFVRDKRICWRVRLQGAGGERRDVCGVSLGWG
jgi:hypothetical protein